jgi:hypothetical protein
MSMEQPSRNDFGDHPQPAQRTAKCIAVLAPFPLQLLVDVVHK